MSSLELQLLASYFSSILGSEVKLPDQVDPKSVDHYQKVSVHDLFKTTYTMRPCESGEDGDQNEDCGFEVCIKTLPGDQIRLYVKPEYTTQDIKAAIFEKQGIPVDQQRLLFYGKQMEDDHTVSDYNIQSECSLHLVQRLRGGSNPQFLLDTALFDQSYDYDFTNKTDDGKTYMRGGFEYRRPYGWKRIAIKVLGKYEDDLWLGPNGIRTNSHPGEWPVSYHGTGLDSAQHIIQGGYKPGRRIKFGPGVYSSPSLETVARDYSQVICFDGKRYKMVLQNRVNPAHLQVISASKTGVGAEYWLLTNGADIRPYGFLIKEITPANQSPLARNGVPAKSKDRVAATSRMQHQTAAKKDTCTLL